MERPRLLDLMEHGTGGPLTLISAPAGSGKTVLLKTWIAAAAGPERIAHLVLAREHADRTTFWTDVLSAIGRARPEFVGVARPVRDARSLAAVRNALAELSGPLLLVLDDFHSIGSGEVLADLEWLLEHAHDGLHLVLATRSDPPFRLQRLRVSGRLKEVREADLAFTQREAAKLLAPLDLTAEDVETLWARSEGWAAGLRLAELSLQDHLDRPAFVAGFAGDDHMVSDYVMSEVVSDYTDDELLFLLRTSLVDRLNGELANALADTSAGERVLHELERADGFVRAIDADGTWYRYHRLFAEVLRGELRRRLPDELASLHRAASRWFARHGEPLEAVRHAVAACDWPFAAEVVGAQWLVCVVRGSGAVLRGLARQIPADVVRGDAELALATAGLLLEAGEIEDADELLARAGELAEDLPVERGRRFAVTATATSLYRARLDGDLTEVLRAARLALSERWDRSVAVEVRALTLANLGIAEFWADDLEEALEHLQAGAGLAREFGNDFVLFIAQSYLAAVDARQGRLLQAHRRARAAIQLAECRGWTMVPHAAIAYVTLANVHLWWNDPEEAERVSQLARDALGRSPEPLLAPVVAQIRARLHALRGDPATGLDVLRAGDDEKLPPWLRVSAKMIEAELWLDLGEPARSWKSLAEIASAEASDFAIGAARLELAGGKPEAALRAIAGFLADEREAVLPVARTEAWAIDAIARDAIHDEPAALRAIERALDLAELRGYSNAIVRYGPPVRSLLRRRIATGTAHRAFAGELLSTLGEAPTPGHVNGNPLLEPLSERELAVLRFLPTMLSNAEIASEMFVSVNTVKTHLKHIYRKLDVSDRREAIRRGRGLRLLESRRGA